MKNILDKPIKAKTLKKKLGESIGDTHISTHYNYRDGKKTTYEVKFLGERGYSQKKIKEEPLQNNKPSIELIEKLDLHDMVKEHLNTDTVWDVNSWILLTILDKINQIIEELNSLKTRVNLIDEEDNN
jgi:hypothetical protein